MYLSLDEASRQIRGIPHPITFSQYNNEADACTHVQRWLEANRARIEDGPRRRSNRNLTYYPLTAALSQAWHRTFNKTDTALRAGLQPAAVDCLVESPARMAVAPYSTVMALAAELGVPIGRRTDLRLPQARAWVQAADADGWDDDLAEKVLFYALLRASERDLTSARIWAQLRAEMEAE